MTMTSPPSGVYSKSNPNVGGEKMSPRAKRILIIVSALITAAVIGGSIWGALAEDKYGNSANGCVSLTLPSTTGAGTLHYCGAQAKAFCRNSFAQSDPVSLAARPQCDLAGLTKAKVAAAG